MTLTHPLPPTTGSVFRNTTPTEDLPGSIRPHTVNNGTGTAVNNSYRTSATSEQSGFYTALGGNAFTEQISKSPPVPTARYQTSGAWNAVPTSVKYSFNATKEVRDARTANAYYAPNTL
ncbi:MAG: hypothetical protein R3C61_25120 [Bacteroidia bacterium]